jgi:hypothetical protein
MRGSALRGRLTPVKKKKKKTPRPINCFLFTAFGFYSSRSNVQTLSGLGVPNHITKNGVISKL